MTPEMKKHLEAVVVATANEQPGEAKAAFSKYLRLKTQSILLGEEDDMDDDTDDEKEEDKDDDNDDEKKENKKEKKNGKNKDDDEEDK